MKRNFRFRVNGLEIDAQFDIRDAENVLLPLLKRLSDLQREKGRRICVFLAAPPAAGKTTLCLYLERLSRENEGLIPVQSVGIDGFHRYQKDLERSFIERDGQRIALSKIKGAPESYDTDKLKSKIEALGRENQYWPLYDRRIHDPVEDAIEIREKILIVEGNWLLLDEAPWNELKCDYSIFIRAGDEGQLERIIRRKMLGGYSEAQAREMAYHNDWLNICRCMANSRSGDLMIQYNKEGCMEVVL